MAHPVYPCFWFDGGASDAAALYCRAFPGGEVLDQGGVTHRLRLEGQAVMLLDGGPMFRPNPAMSLQASCEDPDEVDRRFALLADGGKTLMPLDAYPWSPRFGWVEDRWGVSWQLMAGPPLLQPMLMFVGAQFGNAEAALRLYADIFGAAPGADGDETIIGDIQRHPAGDPAHAGKVLQGSLRLRGTPLSFMDSGAEHAFAFTEGTSLVVECETQAEIDHFWDRLTAEGGRESQCGWLVDRFGLSWQIVPAELGALMADPERGPRVIAAFMKMKKFDIQALRDA